MLIDIINAVASQDRCTWHLPDVGLCAAGPLELVLHQVGVMGGGDEVMVNWLGHVLVHFLVGGVEDKPLLLVQVHQETILGHVLLLLGCNVSTKILKF